jgi:hypothetical protein
LKDVSTAAFDSVLQTITYRIGGVEHWQPVVHEIILAAVHGHGSLVGASGCNSQSSIQRVVQQQQPPSMIKSSRNPN